MMPKRLSGFFVPLSREASTIGLFGLYAGASPSIVHRFGEMMDADGEFQLDADALFEIGDVIFDHAESARWYRRAAEQDHAKAQRELGKAYYFGRGVPESKWEAYIWLSLAEGNGAKMFYVSRNEIVYELSPDELAAAKAEVVRRHHKIQGRMDESASAISSTTSRNDAESVFENTWRSVVVVFAGDTQGGGVIVGDQNQVATNCHVVDESSRDIRVYKGAERQTVLGTPYSAKIIAGDRKRDVCLLSVPGLWGIAAEIRTAKNLEIGEEIYAVGAPQGFNFSISDGIVSQLRALEGESAPFIQTSAAISPGSSGGGLFDSQGRLVGLTTWKIREGENLNFAIPIDWVLELSR